MRTLRGKVAVVTGAGSGIGRATALALAQRGCRIAASDVDAASAETTAEAVRKAGGEARSYQLDVADRDAVYAHADDVIHDFGGVHIVINNAGVALSAVIEQMTYEDFEWLMGINFWGVVYGTKAFLPHLKLEGEGHIVNISSVFGLIGIPTQAAYNAAKFAVRGFTEALRMELELADCGVSCTSVHPGGIKTNIARSSRVGGLGRFNRPKENMVQEFDKMARTSPEAAAEAIVRGIVDDAPRVLIGSDAHLIDTVQRLAPTRYREIVKKLYTRREES